MHKSGGIVALAETAANQEFASRFMTSFSSVTSIPTVTNEHFPDTSLLSCISASSHRDIMMYEQYPGGHENHAPHR